MPSLGRYDVLPAAAPPTASQRLVWDCRCGAIAIDVVGKQVFVDGDLVEPATD